MPLYNLHVAHDLNGGFIVSVFPDNTETAGTQTSSLGKIRYQSAEKFNDTLKSLPIPEAELPNCESGRDSRLPLVFAKLPLTKRHLENLYSADQADPANPNDQG